jgi:hypothetical protein
MMFTKHPSCRSKSVTQFAAIDCIPNLVDMDRHTFPQVSLHLDETGPDGRSEDEICNPV